MKGYKGVFYDLDGTVLNTLDMNMYPLMKIIEEETGEAWRFDQVIKFASYPGMAVMEELGFEDKERVYARWVRYVNEYEEGAVVFEGFVDVFEALASKGIVQGIVSAKTREQYEVDVVRQGLDRFMQLAILADDTKQHKPHPEPLLLGLNRVNLLADEVLYIGDSLADYQAAQQAQMDFAYAKWGSMSAEGILHPTYVLQQPKDVLTLFE